MPNSGQDQSRGPPSAAASGIAAQVTNFRLGLAAQQPQWARTDGLLLCGRTGPGAQRTLHFSTVSLCPENWWKVSSDPLPPRVHQFHCIFHPIQIKHFLLPLGQSNPRRSETVHQSPPLRVAQARLGVRSGMVSGETTDDSECGGEEGGPKGFKSCPFILPRVASRC